MAESIFNTLNAISVNDHTETIKKQNKKTGKSVSLTYLSWAWAWAELKKNYPDSFYTIYENSEGLFYHTDGRTAWVKTGVTVVDGDKQLEHIEYLPVMNNYHESILLENIKSTDVNTAIQRSLTKAVARHGLGLYIYAGEDLPEVEQEEKKAADEEKRLEAIKKLKETAKKNQIEWLEKEYGKIDDFTFEQADGALKQIIRQSKEKKNDGKDSGS